jgi:peptidoglycan/LPS O-acetylase OafA/YrhL
VKDINYRPEIDGLRAIAVLAVIGYHAGISLLPGGFLGVDVFFVISGFVIGQTLKKDFDAKRFSFKGFLARRIRRLAPALVVVVSSTFAISWLFMKPWEIERLSESILSIFGIFSNLHFMKATDYFSPEADVQPLLHFWSLSIEEQFYLFLPLLLAALWHLRMPQWIPTVLRLLLIVSFLLYVFYPYKLLSTRFYSFETRIWELLAGVALAYSSDAQLSFLARRREMFAWIGLALVLASLFMPTWHHVHVLAPVVGTLLVIAATGQGGRVQQFLATPSLVGVGVISYSLYLWHQPVFALARLEGKLDQFAPLQLLAMTALIFCLAIASYWCVEKPARNREAPRTWLVVPASVASAIVLCGIAVFGQYSEGFKKYYIARLPPNVAVRTEALGHAIASRGLAGMKDSGDCRFWSERLTAQVRERFETCAKQNGAAIVVLGDSHGMDLFNALKISSDAPFLFGLSRGACGPDRLTDGKCPYLDFENFVSTQKRSVTQVFFTLSGNYFFDVEVDAVVLKKTLAQATGDYVLRLSKHVPVAWIGPQYEPRINLERLDPEIAFESQIMPADVKFFQARDRSLRMFVEDLALTYVSKQQDVLLDARKDFFVDGNITYSDSDHWSESGEALFGKRLIGKLRKLRLLP